MSVVLVVDDQVNVRQSLSLLLEHDGHQALQADSAAAALRQLGSHPVDVVVTDVRLERHADGAALLRAVKERDNDIEVVLITAFGSIDDAVAAMRAGAYDYLTKPADPERLLLTVKRAAERASLSREVKQLRAEVAGRHQIVAASGAMRAVLITIGQLATTDSTVLITGESGTGKELLGRALYERSARAGGRFVPINCGAIPESMLESELFGHRKGAFTGAIADKKGLLEEADRGVLFLDEIGEMPQSMQVKLLRFLQGGEVRRIGDTSTRTADVRLVAATHRALEREVAEGRFREDFYYRINVVGVRIPPLRERVDDIQPLADFFLRRHAARMGKTVEGFSEGAAALMRAYAWPGNVRELANSIERALNLASGPLITEADLPASLTVRPAAPIPFAPHQDERSRLLSALEQSRWNQSRAARSLGMSRTTLWRKMREHRIEA